MTTILTLLLSVSVFAQSTIKVNEKKPDCETCVRIEKFKDEADSNPHKAARSFAKYLDPFELSKDAKIRQSEMDHILSIAAQVIDKDDRFDIQQYMWTFEKENPTEYKVALGKLTPAEQKLINSEVDKVRSMMETGKEPKEPGEP